MRKRKKIIVANWKMNPQNIFEAKRLFLGVKKTASRLREAQTIICPSFAHLFELKKSYGGGKIAFGAQDVFWNDKNPHTGEVSARMLKDAGVKYVILGHSERRALWESNEAVNKKVIAALGENLKVILCVGEMERDARAEHLAFIKEELRSALSSVPQKSLNDIIIAYEPIWAIGKSAADALTPVGMHEMSIFIKKILSEIYDRKTAYGIPIIYGGSVERANAEDLLKGGEIDGFLIGHASLKAGDFNRILEIAGNCGV
jgi:triosephosphate isomerase (TIM)